VRKLVSVVLSTFQRKHLLERSLVGYQNQEFDNDRFELIVVDDHSTDGTRDLVMDWSRTTKISSVVLTPSPKNTSWQDCAVTINAGIRASLGEHVLLTHPEVIPGRRSVAACVEQLSAFEEMRTKSETWALVNGEPKRVVEKPFGGTVHVSSPLVGLYACCRIYYLSPREQELIDTCPWREKGALAVREIDGFYEQDTNGHPDYSHRATDVVAQPGSRMPVWESFVFSGHSRETWKRLGGMLESREWGSVDVAWTHRRRTLGIPNHTCPGDDTICVHQNHDLPGNVPTDRDMDKWVRELKDYPLTDRAKMVYPTVDNLGWGG